MNLFVVRTSVLAKQVKEVNYEHSSQKSKITLTHQRQREPMTEDNKPENGKKPKEPKPSTEPIDYDWRDPSKPRNPEDDVIVDGWRRRADGTFEKVESEQNSDSEKDDS